MIDGLKCVCGGIVPAVWTDSPFLNFGVLVSEHSGELLSTTKQAEYNGLTFRISGDNSRLCLIYGSLHKYYNNGDNSNNYTLEALKDTIADLSARFGIDPQATIIQRIEIGLNIPLDYSPQIIIKAAIAYKYRGFDTIRDHARRRFGKICEFSDYAVKLYDKGRQCGKNANILRFELVLYRARALPKGIVTLYDISRADNYTALGQMLLETISNIIFYDFKYKGDGLTPFAWSHFQQYSNPNYWEKLTKAARTRAARRYRAKIAEYGLIDWAAFLIQKSDKILAKLQQKQAEAGQPFPQEKRQKQAQGGATFSTLDCLYTKVAPTNGRGNLCKADINGGGSHRTKCDNVRRYCVVCGRDISAQRAGSRFCSERLFGKEARQCRNKDSNRRLSIKRKIYKAMRENKYLAITYEYNGVCYSDILAPAEIDLRREVLDSIKEIFIIDRPTKRIRGKEAIEYLQKLKEQSNGRTNK